jgi:nitrate reductase (NAD(P)H)
MEGTPQEREEGLPKKIEKLDPPSTPPSKDDNVSDHFEEADHDIPLPSETNIPTEVLDIDKKTPDAYVPRDPRLIRLTGVHPFNVEAPLSIV